MPTIDPVTSDMLYHLALKLSRASMQSAKTLATQIGVQEDSEFYKTLSHHTPSQQVLMVLWSWQRKVGSGQATKQKLSEALQRMGMRHLVTEIYK